MAGANYILIFDLPRSEASMLVKVNRLLHKIKAERVQYSVWRSQNLEELKFIAEMINKSNGNAMVLSDKLE